MHKQNLRNEAAIRFDMEASGYAPASICETVVNEAYVIEAVDAVRNISEKRRAAQRVAMGEHALLVPVWTYPVEKYIEVTGSEPTGAVDLDEWMDEDGGFTQNTISAYAYDIGAVDEVVVPDGLNFSVLARIGFLNANFPGMSSVRSRVILAVSV